MRTHTPSCLKVNWNIQCFHIPKEIQISVIHSSSNTHSPISLTVSLSSPNSLTHTLYFSSLSLISHFSQSHQLLHPKMTAHTQYVHNMLHSVTESKIKRFSNFISQIPQKTYPLRKPSQSHIKISQWICETPIFQSRLSLSSSLSSSLRSLRSWSEIVFTSWKKGKC